MKQFLTTLSHQRRYWAALATLGVILESSALYQQYVLDEWPCVLCIHVRIWVMSFVIIGLLAMFLVRSTAAMRLCHGLVVIIMIGLMERSWQVLAVERGWVFGDCAMDLGMPAWFALDKWFPWMFEVQTSCGYTPLIIFNITMAEVLLVFSGLLLIISVTMFIVSWISRQP